MLKKATAATYTYNEVGERTKTEPASGPATTYGYDQAGNLISVTRPKGTEAAIEDTYGYNGDGLRTSETISGTTTYLAWDLAEKLPVILNDGINSYIYSPGGLPVEQINNSSGTVLYLHHDQQGSTRLLTSSTGKTEATFTYDAYGNKTGSTGTSTTSMGYDGQYTNADTGLIYLRARDYDPVTGQFLSVDPEVEQTREAYGYAGRNPMMNGDPTGRSILGDALEAAHYIITAGAIVGCAAQPELCVTAALFDVLLNSADTGTQAALHEKSVASALKEEVFTLVGGAVSFGSAKFWGKLTEWAKVNKLLGTSASDIARNARLLNSGAAHWSVVQAAVSKLIQEKEGKCTLTN